MLKNGRRKLAKHLPASVRQVAQRSARIMDKITGWPTSPLRRGSAVMFHVGRSGSTVLGNMLDKHPKIYWDAECLHTEHKHSPESIKGDKLTVWLKRQMWMAGSGYYGFEVKPLADQHLSFIDKDLSALLCDLEAVGFGYYILLKRKNSLRRMVSQYIGAKSGVRHIATDQELVKNKVRIDVNNVSFGDKYMPRPLISCLRDIDEVFLYLEKKLPVERTLLLTYEEDIEKNGPSIAYEKVCKFLSIAALEVSPDLRKTNPFALSELIENYEEVCDHLSGSEYEWMLYDT